MKVYLFIYKCNTEVLALTSNGRMNYKIQKAHCLATSIASLLQSDC